MRPKIRWESQLVPNYSSLHAWTCFRGGFRYLFEATSSIFHFYCGMIVLHVKFTITMHLFSAGKKMISIWQIVGNSCAIFLNLFCDVRFKASSFCHIISHRLRVYILKGNFCAALNDRWVMHAIDATILFLTKVSAQTILLKDELYWVPLLPFIVIRQPTDYFTANPHLRSMRSWAGQSTRNARRCHGKAVTVDRVILDGNSSG